MTTALRVEVLADRVQVRAACLLGGVHVGDLALDQLEFADALAELLAVVDVGNNDVHRSLHQAQRAPAEYCAFVVEATHQYLDAFADAAKHVFFRHLDILKHQFASVRATHAELVELLRNRETGGAFLEDESGHALGASGQIGFGVDHQHIAIGAVGDPHLGAVEHVAIAFFIGAQLHRNHVGTGVGLAHGQRADVFARNQLWQKFALLRLAAIAVDLVDAKVGVGAVRQADAASGA